MNAKASQLLERIRRKREGSDVPPAEALAKQRGWQVSSRFDLTRLYAAIENITHDATPPDCERISYFRLEDRQFPVAAVLHCSHPEDFRSCLEYANRHALHHEQIVSWHADCIGLLIYRRASRV